MSVISSMIISSDEINVLKELKAKGVAYFKSFKGYDGNFLVLDFEKCNPVEWKKQKKEILKEGVKYFEWNDGCRQPHRRDYKENEKQFLGFGRINLLKDESSASSIYFTCNYDHGHLNDCLMYVSDALKDVTLHVLQTTEGELDFKCDIKNSKEVQ